MSKQVTRINPDRLAAANRDIFSRIEQRGVYLVYDDVLDTLFVEVRGPRKAVNAPVDEYVMLRIDPVSLEVTGGEIPQYLSEFVPRHPQFANFIARLGVCTNGECSYSVSATKVKSVGRLLQAWITAFYRAEHSAQPIRRR